MNPAMVMAGLNTKITTRGQKICPPYQTGFQLSVFVETATRQVAGMTEEPRGLKPTLQKRDCFASLAMTFSRFLP
ncbi:MAG TPA: hypothetical protein DDW84_04175 [Phycisphaerales bacterium]|nr:MAG: hypothetical protein A2Y13_04755 [Planctomycetes bacterium GWC2_45_44]HBG78033.1 hypothetical protein [Phycisphaerales bacterium]HBR18710.1 hypothetical protein [Phycisphaerales bacterium]